MPDATPVTTPVPDTTVASAVLLLVHAPPPVALVRVVVRPIHTFGVPLMDAGSGLTVTGVVVIQPVFKV